MEGLYAVIEATQIRMDQSKEDRKKEKQWLPIGSNLVVHKGYK
jgi:hypothetical protein